MTSWLKHSATKPLPKKDSLFFETDSAGFCSQFNNYLYATLYAKSLKTRLYVNDTANSISIRYPLLRNTFVPVSDLSDVQFTDGQMLTASSIKNRVIPLRVFLSTVSPSNLRTAARSIFEWNDTLLEKMMKLVDHLPSEIDVAVHMRGGDKIITGEMRPLTVEQYVREVETYFRSSKKQSFNVFLMSDSPERIEEFTKKAPSSWKVHTLRSPISPGGHVQRLFNAAPARERMDSYLSFMAELYVAQRVPRIFCTFSSNVGRFLYLTADDRTNVVSIDEPKFVAF